MKGLELNKILASVLLAGVIGMSISIITEGLYRGEENGEPEKRGYAVPGAETAETATQAPKEEGPVDILPYLAQVAASGDYKTKGPQLINRCTSCHTFEKGGPNRVGPNQYGLVGNTFAHKDDFSYSEGLKSQHGKKTWTFQNLSDFLTDPAKYIPGTKMTYSGVKKPEERAELIAYINTLSDHPLPLPSVKDHPMPKPGEPAAAGTKGAPAANGAAPAKSEAAPAKGAAAEKPASPTAKAEGKPGTPMPAAGSATSVTPVEKAPASSVEQGKTNATPSATEPSGNQ
jgi:cytochrome c